MIKIFLGPPGSGKGTAASKIAPKFNVPHISTGDLFRQHIKENTITGQKAQEHINKGEFVPDKITIEILKQRISQDDCKSGFILDGFPRTIKQAKKLKQITNIDIVININVPEEIIIKRLSSRVTCKQCKEIYNLLDIPTQKYGVCDKCQGEIIQRDDDKPEVIQNRLNIYKKETQPLIEFYQKQEILKTISCPTITQTKEETLQKILNAINEFVEGN